MKRLVLLTLILLPLSIGTLRHGGPRRPHHTPHHRGPSPAAIPAPTDADDGFPADGGLVRAEVRSLPMATEERATQDVRRRADALLAKRLEGYGVPTDWRLPPEAIDPIVSYGPIEATERDYGTIYVRSALVDDSEPQLRRLADRYERHIASRRLFTLGGGLAFALLCLGALNGYIRADEATRGYYTRRLRLAAIAAVGASGVALYRWMA